MTTQTTRRGLIGGAGLAAVVAMAPAVASVRVPAISTAKWDALVVAFRKADAHMKAVGAEHDAGYKRYSAAVETLGPRPRASDYSRDAYPKPVDQMTVDELRPMSLPKSPEYAAYEGALAAGKVKDDALVATGRLASTCRRSNESAVTRRWRWSCAIRTFTACTSMRRSTR